MPKDNIKININVDFTELNERFTTMLNELARLFQRPFHSLYIKSLKEIATIGKN